MNNLVNGIIILVVIAALTLSIIALVQPCKSQFEDGECPSGSCPNTEQWKGNCACFYCRQSKYKNCPRPSSNTCRSCPGGTDDCPTKEQWEGDDYCFFCQTSKYKSCPKPSPNTCRGCGE